MLGFEGETGKWIGIVLGFDTFAFDKFCEDLGVDDNELDENIVYEALSHCHNSTDEKNYYCFGSLMIVAVAEKVIRKYVELGLEEDKFDIESDASFPSLSYDGKRVHRADLDALVEKETILKQ